MARKIRGMTIELGADVSKFEKAMKDAYDQTAVLKRRINDINSLLKVRPDDQSLYKQGFDALNKSIEVSKKKLVELNKVYDDMHKQFSEGKIGNETLMAFAREIKATENDIKKLEKALKDLERRSSTFSKLQADVKNLDDKLNNTRKTLNEVDKALKLDPKNVDLLRQKQALLTDSVNQTKEKLILLKKAQEEAVREFEKGNIARDEYAKISSQVVQTTNDLKSLSKEADIGYQKLSRLSEESKKYGERLGQLGKSLTTKITLPIAGIGATALNEYKKLEQAMAGVHKTTDLTKEELDSLQKEFTKMSFEIPVSAVDLAGIAEMGGQLGIHKDNLVDFTKTIAGLDISTNLGAEEGAKQLAQFMNVAGTSQDKISNLASTLVDLGNNYSTTEADIMEMSSRLVGQGKIIGLTEAEMLGLATAMSSVKINSEAGGSALSRIMMKMNKYVIGSSDMVDKVNESFKGTGHNFDSILAIINKGGKGVNEVLNEIGASAGMSGSDLRKLVTSADKAGKRFEKLTEVTGMSADKFTKMWKERPMEAINLFLRGLSKMNDRGEDLSYTFEILEMSSIREQEALLKLINSGDLTTRAVRDANNAFKENTALKKETSIFSETLASRLERLKNRFLEVGRKIGDSLVPMLEKLMDWLEGIAIKIDNMKPEEIEAWVKAFLGLASLGPIVSIVGKLFDGLSFVSGRLGEVSGLMAGFKASGGIFEGILAGLKGVLFGPVGIIAGLVGVGLAIKGVYDYMSKPSVDVDIFGDSISASTKKAVEGFLELDRNASTTLSNIHYSGVELSQKSAKSIVDAFEGMGAQIKNKLDSEKDTVLASIQSMYDSSSEIDEAEKLKKLEAVELAYEQQREKVDEGLARIKEITERASSENRRLTNEEYQEITGIQMKMKNDGISILAENEQEVKVIRQRMKDEAGTLSVQQASEIIKASIQQRDETIKNAEEEYDKRIRAAEKLRQVGGEENEKLADEIIAAAKHERDETVKTAWDRHDNILSVAKDQADEHIRYVDLETGEIKSKWQVFGENINTWWNEFSEGSKKNIKKLLDWITSRPEAIQNAIDEGLRKLGEFIEKNIKEPYDRAEKWLQNFFTNLPNNIYNWFVKTWNDIKQGLKDLILNPFKDIVESIKSIFNFEIPLPRIKLPHLKWTEYQLPFGSITVPTGVKWYKKGAIFTKPTMFNTPYGMKGVGEAGPEAVLPIEKLSDIFADTMRKTNGGGNIYISGNEFVVREDADIERIAKELSKMLDRKKRGLGVI